MEAVLSARWLRGVDAITVFDEASVSLVRDRVRTLGAAAGLDAARTGSLVNVASELAHNQLAHAIGGAVGVHEIGRDGVRGLEIIAADRGGGIVDPIGALRGRESRSGSLGIGLAAVFELADEVDVDVRLGEGTCVVARKFASDVARHKCVGIIGRPIEGEKVSGDDAVVIRTDETVTVMLLDGLGHGVEARAAATQIIDALGGSSFEGMLNAANAAAIGTRGAVGAVARVGARTIDLRMVGNVSAYVCARHATRRHIGSSQVLGSRSPLREAIAQDTIALGEVLVLFTDGSSSKLSLEQEGSLLHAHPLVIAQTLLERFGTTRDDATIVVVK